jgi:integrase/recombinase XerD
MKNHRTFINLHNQIFKNLSETYHRHLHLLGHSEHGALIKYRYLQHFLQYIETEGIQTIEEISPSHITAYYEKIRTEPTRRTNRPRATGTLQTQVRGMELFFTMLQETGQLTQNPFSTLKFTYPKQHIERTVLTPEEIQLLYGVCKTLQERAVLSFAYGCGLRVSEIVALNVEDIKLQEGFLIVKRGKGNKRRVIPMSEGVKQDLSNYFYYERPATLALPETAFMLHSKGGRMKKYTYNKLLKKLIDRANNEIIRQKQVSIHTLRHSIATHLLEQGMSIEQVRVFLGHAELESTEIYTHVSWKQLDKLI